MAKNGAGGPSEQRRQPGRDDGGGVSPALWLLLVGAPTLLALLLHLELRGSEFFRVLAVDARTYHETAVALAGGTYRPDGPWWQPPFYPLFLSLIYRLFGSEPTAAYVVQALLHGGTAAMVFGLGRSWFGNRAAWIAWGIVAGFGPLVFHTQQLLPPTLSVALLVASIALLSRPRALWTSIVAGLLLGLAVITVASLLLVLPVLLWWLWKERDGARGGGGLRARWIRPAVFAATTLLPALLVTGWNARAGGEAVFISYNGGINFWIGNNPEYDRTVAIRPGRAWKALTLEPQIAGARGYNAQSRWFYDRAFRWMGENPGAALSLGIRKLHLALRGDELMRNQAIYPFRSESLILRLLLGSLSPAFPFGWLWPLALVGVWAVRRERGAASRPAGLLGALALVLLISVVAFFVAGRYRLPMVPFLALLAGPGVVALVTAARARSWGRDAPGFALLALGLLVAHLGVPRVDSAWNSDALYDVGLERQRGGDRVGAKEMYERALTLDPNNLEATNNLAGLWMEEGRSVDALPLFQKVLAVYPDDRNARSNLGAAYLRMGECYLAGNEYQRILARDPNDALARGNLQMCDAAAAQLEQQWMGSEPAKFLDAMLASFRADPSNGYLRARMTPLFETAGRAAELTSLPPLATPR